MIVRSLHGLTHSKKKSPARVTSSDRARLCMLSTEQLHHQRMQNVNRLSKRYVFIECFDTAGELEALVFSVCNDLCIGVVSCCSVSVIVAVGCGVAVMFNTYCIQW